ncbi:MAG: hypothetical protein ORN54_15010, partial [Cyclobacteriaceae bacterium]|nr:hypothetical protein [Cyclobacteriaceae bacterium]
VVIMISNIKRIGNNLIEVLHIIDGVFHWCFLKSGESPTISPKAREYLSSSQLSIFPVFLTFDLPN